MGLALLALAMGQPLPDVGVAYAIAFVMIAWNRPDVALLLIFVAAPFQTDLSNGDGFARFSLAELNLTLTLLVLLIQNALHKRRAFVGPIALPVMLYFAVCLLSSLLNWQGDSALISIIQMALYFIVAVMLFASFPRRPEQLMLSLNGLVWVGVFLAVGGMATSYGLLGMNKNGLGSSLSCALLVTLELWFAAKTTPRKLGLTLAISVLTAGLVLSLSRGAWLGALAGMIVIVVLRRQYQLLAKAACILVPLVVLCWVVLPQDSKDYALDFDSKRGNIAARYQDLDFARQYFEQSPVIGVGVGLRKQYDATNLVWSTLAETGVLGLASLSLIYLAFYRMIWWTQKYVLRTDTAFTFLVAGGALVMDKLVHGMVDHYWSRGAITLSWASAGMAVGVYYAVRQRLGRGRG